MQCSRSSKDACARSDELYFLNALYLHVHDGNMTKSSHIYTRCIRLCISSFDLDALYIHVIMSFRRAKISFNLLQKPLLILSLCSSFTHNTERYSETVTQVLVVMSKSSYDTIYNTSRCTPSIHKKTPTLNPVMCVCTPPLHLLTTVGCTSIACNRQHHGSSPPLVPAQQCLRCWQTPSRTSTSCSHQRR